MAEKLNKKIATAILAVAMYNPENVEEAQRLIGTEITTLEELEAYINKNTDGMPQFDYLMTQISSHSLITQDNLYLDVGGEEDDGYTPVRVMANATLSLNDGFKKPVQVVLNTDHFKAGPEGVTVIYKWLKVLVEENMDYIKVTGETKIVF